jgi:hypothetical protein
MPSAHAYLERFHGDDELPEKLIKRSAGLLVF